MLQELTASDSDYSDQESSFKQAFLIYGPASVGKTWLVNNLDSIGK